MPVKKIHIAIVDDHPLFLEGVLSLLMNSPDIHIAGTALNATGLLDLLKREAVDVLLCDISMPDITGLELTRIVKKLYPSMKILILTMHEEPRMIRNMMKAGVNGYLFKNSGKDLLLASIKEIAGGSAFTGDEAKNRLKPTIGQGVPRVPIPKLSAREKEVLLLVSKEFTTQEIAEQLFVSHHTVLSHRKKLLYKFEVNNTAGLIKKAIETGLLD